MPQDRVCVGAISGAFGVRGEAKLKCFTAEPKAIANYGPLQSEDGGRLFEIEITRTIKGGLAARLSGVDTREQVEALKGTRLYVDRAVLPPTDEDEFYYADLIGLAVEDQSGEKLGKIKAVHEYGAGDVIEYQPVAGGESMMLSFTREIVPKVDVAGGKIIVVPPEDDSET